MVLILYYDSVSSGCRAVYMLLNGNGVPFLLKQTELQTGQHKEPEFTKINPYQKIPTIEEDNGYILTESAAIMKYIAIKYKLEIHWYPWDEVEKSAKVDEYLHWHHLNIRKPFVTILLELVPTRLDGWLGIPKRPANEALVNEAKKELEKAITNIADYYLKDKLFLIGDEISIADLSGVAELTGLRGCNEEGIYESNAVVCAWVRRVQDHVKKYFEEAMESIEATRKQYNSSKE